jgi:hypothetical protein
MQEFNKAGAEPCKRKKFGEGIIFGSSKEIGESMYNTLVTRDTTPQEGQGEDLRQLQIENHRSGVVANGGESGYIRDGHRLAFRPPSSIRTIDSRDFPMNHQVAQRHSQQQNIAVKFDENEADFHEEGTIALLNRKGYGSHLGFETPQKEMCVPSFQLRKTD